MAESNSSSDWSDWSCVPRLWDMWHEDKGPIFLGQSQMGVDTEIEADNPQEAREECVEIAVSDGSRVERAPKPSFVPSLWDQWTEGSATHVNTTFDTSGLSQSEACSTTGATGAESELSTAVPFEYTEEYNPSKYSSSFGRIQQRSEEMARHFSELSRHYDNLARIAARRPALHLRRATSKKRRPACTERTPKKMSAISSSATGRRSELAGGKMIARAISAKDVTSSKESCDKRKRARKTSCQRRS